MTLIQYVTSILGSSGDTRTDYIVAIFFIVVILALTFRVLLDVFNGLFGRWK